jgi:xylulokinase
MTNLLGFEIGATGCRANLFDDRGLLLHTTSRDYPVELPQPQWAEQDIERVWQLVRQVLQEVLYNAGVSDIAALALSVHSDAVTPVDDEGHALRPTILGMDTRTGLQTDWLRHNLGAEELFQHTGQPLQPSSTLAKLLWIKENEPQIWEETAKFLLVEDYLIQQMTGKAVVSACLASRTQLYDLDQGNWSTQILETLGLETAQLAEVQPSGSTVATMLPELAASLGLRRAPQIVTGGCEHACAALGAGLTTPGLAMVSTGTSQVLEVVLETPILTQAFYEGNISVYQHVIPGYYLAMTLNHTGEMTLSWFRDAFCELQVEEAARSEEDVFDLILQKASYNPTELMVLPHFSSTINSVEGAPKGAILGLTFGTTRVEIVKAILEGLTYELRLKLDTLWEGGVKVEQLNVIGDGTSRPLWLQIKADICGVPVVVPHKADASGWGAALLAGLGAGIYPDAVRAVERTQQDKARYDPRPGSARAYEDRYALYRELHPAVREISARL